MNIKTIYRQVNFFTKLAMSLNYDKYDILYHGTSKDAANKILQEGFSLSMAGSKSGQAMPGISTSLDLDIAKSHALWAARKKNNNPSVLIIDGSKLKIAPGKLYFELWGQLGSSEDSIKEIKKNKDYDGVALFDPDTGDGVEEQEILIFNPSKIQNISLYEDEVEDKED